VVMRALLVVRVRRGLAPTPSVAEAGE